MPLDQQNFQLETQNTTLPDKPSELIRVALLDLEKAERADGYAINMGDWHEYYKDTYLGLEYSELEDSGKCRVCLAGCVMAFSLKANRKKSLFPSSFAEEESKLEALDSFRIGCVDGGFRAIKLGSPPFDDYEVKSYGGNPTQFKADMRGLANALEEAGY